MAIKQLVKTSCLLAPSLLVLILSGCISGKDPQDPYQGYNHQIYRFNDAVDKAVLRPVAKGYNKVVPEKVQARVTDFFGNLYEIPTVANDILQLQVYHTLNDFSRFVVNTTLGIGGIFDVASHMGLPEHTNDFGLTLADWGMPNSPYFIIPILGPSTVRDTFGDAGNHFMSVWPYVNPYYVGYSAWALDKVNVRASLLPTDQLVADAFDPYVFVRDAYLQHRKSQISALKSTEDNNQTHTNEDTFVEKETANSKDHNDTTTKVPSPSTKGNDNKDTFVPAQNDKAVDEKGKSHVAEKQNEPASDNKIQNQANNLSLPAPRELS